MNRSGLQKCSFTAAVPTFGGRARLMLGAIAPLPQRKTAPEKVAVSDALPLEAALPASRSRL